MPAADGGIVREALHANCGNCHNSHGTSWPDTDLTLRLSVNEHEPEQTLLYRSAVGVDMQKQGPMFPAKRIVRGQPLQSGVYVRMATREQKLQMPPFATKQVDGQVGVPEVMAWIESL